MKHLTEQQLIRREKLDKIRALGIDPYPAEAFEVTTDSQTIHEGFDLAPQQFADVALAGRVMAFRIMGKASFAELQDAKGRIQLYISRDDICPGDNKDLYNELFKKLLDIGDIIGVRGSVFRTKVGEISVHVYELKFLCKALNSLPIVKRDDEGHTYHGFTDPEQRYRRRYVDLIVNPEVRQIFVQRARLISTMRHYFDRHGWLEVETPVLQSIHGGAAARPFRTHHNTLDIPLYLRIANELYLKRLVVGGFDGVYEFAKMFRNEGMDRTHNPEFTAVELYVAYRDYFWLMERTEELLAEIAIALHHTTETTVWGHSIQWAGPYRRLPLLEGIEQYTGIDISHMDEDGLRQVCQQLGVRVEPTAGKGKLIDKIFGAAVEPHLIQPTFVTDHPIEMSPLTKKHRSKPGLVERFELFVCGKEVANAYSELNDPLDQRERFEDQLRLAARGDDEAMALDEDFLLALEHGMPPTAGIGFGIDRLVMMFTDQPSIQEVLLFPQMRPEAPAQPDTSTDTAQS